MRWYLALLPAPSLITPTLMPATMSRIGTPASIMERQPPHAEAIDEEPLDSVMSLMTRTV